MKKQPAVDNGLTARYGAFLRGINVGGHKLIKMEALKKAFESMGFDRVETLLASGNVLFDVPGAKHEGLAEKIEGKLKSSFGYEIGVVLRTIQDIRLLADSRPFKNIVVTARTRLYVTFLPQKPAGMNQAPWESPSKGFKIVRVSESEVLSVLTLSPGVRSTDLMGFLDKKFGRKVTTRNWNTIEKLLGVD